MNFFFPLTLNAASRYSCKIPVTLTWCIGLICGIFVAACTDNIASLMRACCNAGVSIVGLIIVPLFPFLFSAIAVYCSSPLLLRLTGFCKSFLLGFNICAVYSVFSGGGFLICLLLLFTDLLTSPTILLFQLRCTKWRSKELLQGCISALTWFFAVIAVDYTWVAPLLRDII